MAKTKEKPKPMKIEAEFTRGRWKAKPVRSEPAKPECACKDPKALACPEHSPKGKPLKLLEQFLLENAPKATKVTHSQMPVICVCGQALALELQPPAYNEIRWHRFCTNCRRHIYYSVR